MLAYNSKHQIHIQLRFCDRSKGEILIEQTEECYAREKSFLKEKRKTEMKT